MMVQIAPPPPPSDLPSVGFLVAALLGSIPIIGVMVWGAVKILSPVTQAMGRWINRQSGDSVLESDVAQMRQELDAMRRELVETQERLDFAERMLARVPAPDRLQGSH